jgi:hypothetical protein
MEYVNQSKSILTLCSHVECEFFSTEIKFDISYMVWNRFLVHI